MNQPGFALNQPAKTGKHPKALYVLFFTEMREWFAYS